MSSSFITQVAMALITAGILFFNVKPAFMEIGVTQDSILQYQEEQEKVNEVNSRLARLVDKMNTVTASDMKALLTFVPDTIDHVAISRDINFMSEQAEVILDDVSYASSPQTLDSNDDPNAPIMHSFSVSVTGTYAQIKSFLSLLEKNNYPLGVYEFSLTGAELGNLSADILLITYSHLDAEAGTSVDGNSN